MIDLFDISKAAPQDRSIYYLSQLFGKMNGILKPTINPGDTAPGDTSIVGTMFSTFNTAMLVIGALIIVYVVVIGAMKTAHEGEAMGKQWNSLWTPMRIVFGVAGLFPLGSGYCLIQIAMMWFIVQGVGAADVLWNTVLIYLQKTGSFSAQPSVRSSFVADGFKPMFSSLACEATMAETRQIKGAGGIANYYCAGKDPSNPECAIEKPVTLAGSASKSFGPGGACGTLSYCDASAYCKNSGSLGCAFCTAQQKAMVDIIGQQRDVASLLQKADFDYRDFYLNSKDPKFVAPQWIYDYCSGLPNAIPKSSCCLIGQAEKALTGSKCTTYESNTFPNPVVENSIANPPDFIVKDIYLKYALKDVLPPDFIDAQVSYYVTVMTAAMTANLGSQGADIKNLSGDLQNAGVTGWIFAGAFYYTIGKSAASAEMNPPPPPSFRPGNLTSFTNTRLNNGAAATILAQLAQDSTASDTGANSKTTSVTFKSLRSTDPVMGSLINSIGSLMDNTSKLFKDAISKGGNPIYVIQKTGTDMLTGVEIFFGIFFAISLILAIVGNFYGFVLGTGITNPVGPAMLLIYILIIPALYGLMGILAAYGAILAVYIPLIPFMIYTGGVITWFLLVIEAMVAGPLVAIGVMMPGGHHEVLGRAEPALMLLFNIFLRPSLMVFGMLAGMLLSGVLLNIIFYTFWQLVVPAASSQSSSILAVLIYLAAFVGLCVTVVNKSYATIHLLPERVITWIGGHAAGLGIEAEMDRAGKEGTEGAGRGIGGAAAKLGQGDADMAQKIGANHAEKRAEAKKAADKLKNKPPSATPGG